MEDFIQTFFYIIITILAIVFSLIKQTNKKRGNVAGQEEGMTRDPFIDEPLEEGAVEQDYFEKLGQSAEERFQQRKSDQGDVLSSTESIEEGGADKFFESKTIEPAPRTLFSEKTGKIPVKEKIQDLSGFDEENTPELKIIKKGKNKFLFSTREIKKAVIYSEIINRKEF